MPSKVTAMTKTRYWPKGLARREKDGYKFCEECAGKTMPAKYPVMIVSVKDCENESTADWAGHDVE